MLTSIISSLVDCDMHAQEVIRTQQQQASLLAWREPCALPSQPQSLQPVLMATVLAKPVRYLFLALLSYCSHARWSWVCWRGLTGAWGLSLTWDAAPAPSDQVCT